MTKIAFIKLSSIIVNSLRPERELNPHQRICNPWHYLYAIRSLFTWATPTRLRLLFWFVSAAARTRLTLQCKARSILLLYRPYFLELLLASHTLFFWKPLALPTNLIIIWYVSSRIVISFPHTFLSKTVSFFSFFLNALISRIAVRTGLPTNVGTRCVCPSW